MSDERLADLQRFYALLAELERHNGGKRLLPECHGRMDWPQRGVYFFFESGETRCQTGSGLRIVRVGTHAVSVGSNSTLWGRLSSHRGSVSTQGGNHRGSIFRLLIGEALALKSPSLACATWGRGASAPKTTRDLETNLECAVSSYFSRMPFLWLNADDTPSTESIRGYIERNAIALLSNFDKMAPVDAPSSEWLGRLSDRHKILTSGLWNQNHVASEYDAQFLDVFATLLQKSAIVPRKA